VDDVGGRIRLIRSRLGLNQGAFAKRLGLGGAALISKYEQGHLEPKIETLIDISELGRESLDWLLLGGVVGAKAPDKRLQRLLVKVERIYCEGKSAKINALKVLLNGLMPSEEGEG